jgi:hypothetical protein
MSVTMKTKSENNIVVDIWTSLRALPGWVQIWAFLILMPVNMASLFFINEPMGIWVAVLANIAMMMNMPVMLHDRGFSKMMGIPHLIPWTILAGILIFNRPEATGLYDTYLWVLLGTNVISLIFDFPDAAKWFHGDRTPAGR